MHPNDRSEVDGLFSDSDLTTLVDLQKFLAQELTNGEDADLSRAFTPLTDGLGIHNVGKPKAPAAGAVKAGQPSFAPPPPPSAQPMTEFRTTSAPVQDNVRPATRLIIDAGVDSGTHAGTSDLTTAPPPVPTATLGRRLLAGVVDQVFVCLALGLAVVITSNTLLAVGTGDFGVRLVRQLGNPAFLRSVGLEFGMIWLGYLTLSFAILDMSFGMWVWGLRLNYGEESRGWKKAARVVLGMFFYPAVLPSLLLVFRKEGRTLIDSLTQTTVYRIVQN
jgi:uncharacterized RDD family membrane protein YckC